MPILWKVLIWGYLRTFTLSITVFISLMLVSKFTEIARFISLSGSWLKTLLFILYLIPLILPIALPLSALMASLLLFQRLSRSHELTALRASGLPLAHLIAPLALVSLVLACLHFAITAQVAPDCRRASKMLAYKKTSSNPLLLLQRQQLVKLKHAYVHLNVKEEGILADDFLLIGYNPSLERLCLISANTLKMKGTDLVGTDVSTLSHLPAEKFDSLLLENQKRMSTHAPILSLAMKKKTPRLNVNTMDFRTLRLRALEEGKQARAAAIELMKRFTLSLSLFSFTWLGFSFGMESTRNPSKKNLFLALGLTLFVFLSYFFAKALKHNLSLAFFAFLLPHPLIWISSFYKMRSIEKGAL